MQALAVVIDLDIFEHRDTRVVTCGKAFNWIDEFSFQGRLERAKPATRALPVLAPAFDEPASGSSCF